MDCDICGKPLSEPGHQKCHGERERRRAALALAEPDRELLAMRATGLSYDRIASRLGISRPRARQRVQDAKRREGVRERLAEDAKGLVE